MNAFSCTTATLFYLAFVVMSMLLISTLAWTVPTSPPLSSRRDFFSATVTTAMIATTTTFLVVVPTKVNAVELLDDLTMPTTSPTELDTVRVTDVGMLNQMSPVTRLFYRLLIVTNFRYINYAVPYMERGEITRCVC